MRQVSYYLFICFIIISCTSNKELIESRQKEIVISFGSCDKQWNDQSFWNIITSNNPDLWIWTGDIIYADTDKMTDMKKMYDQLRADVNYNNLLATCPVIGIWDDHDYGLNNGGKYYSKKDSSKNLLFEFLDVPKENPAWHHQGAYQSYEYILKSQSIKVILLDIRYFRDDLDNKDGTILGKEQWLWLEKELNNSTADINLIAGGIQFLHKDHNYEKWYNFPKEYDRLLSLIESSKVKNPILISGDRHIAELATTTLSNGKEIYEITSSGLTHSYESLDAERNRFRIGPLVTDKNFGIIRINQDYLDIEIRNIINNVLYSHRIVLD